MIDPEKRVQLSHLIPAAELPATLAPVQVQGFMECLLVLHDFSVRIVRVAAPQILKIETRHSIPSRRPWLPDRIDPDTLPTWTHHPAFRIRTEFCTGKVDARIISNGFRGYITNAGPEFFVPLAVR